VVSPVVLNRYPAAGSVLLICFAAERLIAEIEFGSGAAPGLIAGRWMVRQKVRMK